MNLDRAWLADEVEASDRDVVLQLLRGELPAGAELVVERILRRVARVTLPSGVEVYAKQHLFPFLRVRLRYSLRESPSRRERRLLALAAARGLLVPTAIAEATARAVLGPTLAVIVTRALPPGRMATHEEALRAVDRLVEARVYHPDLHPDNLRIVAHEACYLDFQSVVLRHRVHAADRMAMFAKFAAGGARDAAGRLCVDDRLFASASEAAQLRAAVDALDAAGRAARRRHRLRSSTKVVRERAGLCGLRLRLREFDASDFDHVRFGTERDEVRDHFGPCRVALRDDGLMLRLRLRSSPAAVDLRALWADADEMSGFLGWERTAPWPWGTQALYIHAHRQEGLSRAKGRAK